MCGDGHRDYFAESMHSLRCVVGQSEALTSQFVISHASLNLAALFGCCANQPGDRCCGQATIQYGTWVLTCYGKQGLTTKVFVNEQTAASVVLS